MAGVMGSTRTQADERQGSCSGMVNDKKEQLVKAEMAGP
jgi:hypothetical protein